MRSVQDVAQGLVDLLEPRINPQLASVRTRYQLGLDDADGGLTDIASVVDTPWVLPEPNQMPMIQVECLGKSPETPGGQVEPELGGSVTGNVTVDRSCPCRLWVFLRGQSYSDVAHRQRATATAIEEVLYGNVVFPNDSTLRLNPTTVRYELSDIGLDAKSSRSFGGIRFTFDVVMTEEILPAIAPVGTADTIEVHLARLGLA